MARSVPGQVPYSVIASGVAIIGAVVGAAGVAGPVAGGALVGAGVALAVTELAALSGRTPTVGLVAGGIAAGVVVVVADGVVDLSLPALVAGAGGAAALAGAARYAEHVIAAEGPARPGAAVLARLVIPARELLLALGGQPLREPPSLPTGTGTKR